MLGHVARNRKALWSLGGGFPAFLVGTIEKRLPQMRFCRLSADSQAWS